jgi:hypothetical protein
LFIGQGRLLLVANQSHPQTTAKRLAAPARENALHHDHFTHVFGHEIPLHASSVYSGFVKRTKIPIEQVR